MPFSMAMPRYAIVLLCAMLFSTRLCFAITFRDVYYADYARARRIRAAFSDYTQSARAYATFVLRVDIRQRPIRRHADMFMPPLL